MFPTSHREFSIFSTAVILKIWSRSPKSNQFFVMSQLYIHENLVRIQPLVHKILCRLESVMPTLSIFSTAVTLKIWSKSPKFNHFFVTSQLYIHENLVRIQPLVHKILCRQESVMGSAPKSMSLSPPLRQGEYNEY